MTAIPNEVASKRPAELVIVDSRGSRDFDGPFPLVPFDRQTVARFVRAEAQRSMGGPRALTRGTVAFLRVGAAVLVLAGLLILVVSMARAAAGQ